MLLHVLWCDVFMLWCNVFDDIIHVWHVLWYDMICFWASNSFIHDNHQTPSLQSPKLHRIHLSPSFAIGDLLSLRKIVEIKGQSTLHMVSNFLFRWQVKTTLDGGRNRMVAMVIDRVKRRFVESDASDEAKVPSDINRKLEMESMMLVIIKFGSPL